MPRYLISPIDISAGASKGASIKELAGLIIIGAASTAGQRNYKLYFVSGTNQYDTHFVMLGSNVYGSGLDIYTNDTNRDFSLTNNTSGSAKVWAYFMGR